VSDAVRVTLPDGSVRDVPRGTTARAVAEGIGAGLARAAVAARVNGAVWDLDRPIERDVSLAILTERDPEALEVLRHSAAHVLATAVRDLFPGAGIGFGPPIQDGFYYDFEVPRPFTPEDLERIETKMGEVARADYPFVREVVDRDAANRRFADDPLKLERISADRAAQALQAAERRRRLLAGRREAADAPAHLRHGLVQEGRAGRLPPPPGGGAQA
jgi:threonyl-tRNA synthetase